jgi:hypothetical protein
VKYQPHSLSEREALQARFALRIAARLTEAAEASGADVSSRLRFARGQALQRAREVRLAEPRLTGLGAGGVLSLGRGGQPSRWFKLAALLPLAVLVMGLIGIYDLHDRMQIDAAAQIDAELLADDLPPDAYRDAGFVEFLKSPSVD